MHGSTHPYLLLCRPGETPSREMLFSLSGRAVEIVKKPVTGWFMETETYPIKMFVYRNVPAKCIELPETHEWWTRSRPMTGHYADLPEPAEVAKMLTVSTSQD